MNNHFDYVPSSVNKSRSVFKFHKPVAQSAYLGWLYPMCKPVFMFPGSTLKLNLAMEIRSGALIAPIMDELYCDVFAFNVPNRIVWEHWKQFLGSVDDVLFDNLTEYNIPSFKYRSFDTAPTYPAFVFNQLLANCFELPYLVSGVSTNLKSINALPFRGYTFIWNEFFRPEQIVAPILFSKTDNGGTGQNIDATPTSYTFNGTSLAVPLYNGAGTYTIANGGCVLPTFRVHRSLWTSCLPKPSLESPSILSAVSGTAPVGFYPSGNVNLAQQLTGSNDNLLALNASPDGSFVQYSQSNSGSLDSDQAIFADISKAILTVNALRETLLLQSYYDVLNRAGSRYDEIIRNLFHTQTSNAVTDIPELIVHKRFTIYRNQVIATAETLDSNGATVNPVGSQSAYIDTVIKDSFFVKSTTEHGYIHMLYTIRPANLRMAQGIDPLWTNLSKLDQYYPQFDGMGDVARYKDEIFYDVNQTEAANHGIFGFQEYGAEYKYQRASSTGWLNPYLSNSLSYYTLCENISSQPSLGFAGYQTYITCWSEMEAFARCLSISSPVLAPQFIIDLRLTGEIVHPMPVYNIPGMGNVL